MKKKIIAMLCLLGMLSVASACGVADESSTQSESLGGSVSVEDSDINESTSTSEEGHQHVYGNAVYAWDGDKCTATRTCACEDSETETVTGVYVKDTDASCTENEKGHYEATFENTVFAAQVMAANSVEVPDTVKHSPAEAVLEGREMVTRCSVCDEPIETVPVYTTFNDGDEICDPEFGYVLGDYGVAMEELEDKAVHFEFKFETDGSFNVCLLGADWANVTGYFTVAKSGDSVTTTMGRVVALSDG